MRVKQLQDCIAERQHARQALEAEAEAEFESSLDQTTTMALRLAPGHPQHDRASEHQPALLHPMQSCVSSVTAQHLSARKDPTVHEASTPTAMAAAATATLTAAWPRADSETQRTTDSSTIEMSDIQLHENELMGLYSTVIDINEDPYVQQWRAEISYLQDQIRSAAVRPYHEEFKAEEEDGPLMISTVQPEWLDHHSRTVLRHRLQQVQEEFAAFKSKQAELIWKEHSARQRVLQKERELYCKLNKEREAAYEKHRAHEQQLKRQITKARHALQRELLRKREYLEERFGLPALDVAPHGRRYEGKFETPQLVAVRLHLLTAVKDKLPEAHYAVLLSTYDRLGGRLIRWSRSGAYGAGPGLPGVTLPVHHGGRYFDAEMVFNQTVFVLLPPPSTIRPSNCFVFEVYQLDHSGPGKHAVVGWCALPVLDQDCKLVQGKFKLPMLAGEPNNHFTRYCEIDEEIGAHLESWLANLYFEIRPIGGGGVVLNGASEGDHDVELDYINKEIYSKRGPLEEPRQQLKLPRSLADRARLNALEIRRRQVRHVANSDAELETGAVMRYSTASARADDESKLLKPHWTRLAQCWRLFWSRLSRLARVSSQPLGENPFEHDFTGSSQRPQGAATNTGGHDGDGGGARFEPHADITDWESVGKLVTQEGVDEAVIDDETWWVPELTEAERELFTPAIPKTLRPERPVLNMRTKLKYVLQELSSDLLPAQATSADAYLTGILYLVALWLRMFIHFVAQYLFLKACRVSVYQFDVRAEEIVVKYVSTAVPASVEIGVVLFGPLAVLVAFGLFAAAGWLSLQTVKCTPTHYSKFVAAFGLFAVVDPVLIFLVDCALRNFDCSKRDGCSQYTSSRCQCHTGDAFKLWDRMEKEEGSGVSGMFITLLIYCTTAVLGTAMLYKYLVHVHMNARILDNYKRATALDSELLVPHDFEVSALELDLVCHHSRHWSGSGGNRREVVVTHLDPEAQQTTTHVAIFEHAIGDPNSKTLYRHFLIADDRTIIELLHNRPHTEDGQLLLQRVLQQALPAESG